MHYWKINRQNQWDVQLKVSLCTKRCKIQSPFKLASSNIVAETSASPIFTTSTSSVCRRTHQGSAHRLRWWNRLSTAQPHYSKPLSPLFSSLNKQPILSALSIRVSAELMKPCRCRWLSAARVFLSLADWFPPPSPDTLQTPRVLPIDWLIVHLNAPFVLRIMIDGLSGWCASCPANLLFHFVLAWGIWTDLASSQNGISAISGGCLHQNDCILGISCLGNMRGESWCPTLVGGFTDGGSQQRYCETWTSKQQIL